MRLAIECNGVITDINIQYGKPLDRRQIEFDFATDSFRIYNDGNVLLVKSNTFEMLSPYDYIVVITRLDTSTIAYNERTTILGLYEWIRCGDGEVSIYNARIYIDDRKMQIVIKIPDLARVWRETDTVEELQFKNYIVLDDDKVTIAE